MKSLLLSFLMFAVAMLAIYGNVFDFMSSSYVLWFAVACVLLSLIFAFKILGNPFAPNDKNSAPDKDSGKNKTKSVLFLIIVAVCCIGFSADAFCGVTEQTSQDGSVTYTVNEDGEATSGASKGCTPLPMRYAQIQGCILCPLFRVILNTNQTIATKSYGALAAGFRNLVIMVLALFIAYQTLITVSAFTKQDAPKYISTILVQSFKAALAALLLSNSAYSKNS